MLDRLRARLEHHEFLRHLLILMSGTAVAQVLPIAASPIILRLYTPHEMGLFTMFSAFVAGLVTIATWRYDLAIVLPRKDEDARALVKLSNRTSAITCVVASAVLILLAGPISDAMNAPDLRPWLALVGFTAWATAQVSVFNFWCNRTKNYRLMSTNRIGQSVTTTGGQLAFGVAQVGTFGLVMSVFLGQLVASGNLWRKTRHQIYGQPTSSLPAMLKEHRKMPLLNGPTAFLDTIRLQVPSVMLPIYFSVSTVGLFGQAWRLLQTPASLINSSLSQVFYQKMASTPRGQMSRVVRAGIVRSALLGIVPFALIYFLSPPLFPVIFGEQWRVSGQIGAALVPWLYLNFITSPISMLFLVTRRQGALFWFAIPFTAAPILTIWLFHDELLPTITLLSLVMAAMLCIFLVMAVSVAATYDRGADTDPDHAPQPHEVDELEAAAEAELEVELEADLDEDDLR